MPDIQLPDGSIARFPDDMADADIEAVLQKEQGFQGGQSAPEAQNKSISQPASAIAGLGQGASAGFGDEMLAGLGAGFAGTVLNATNALGLTNEPRPYGSSYDNILENQRTQNQAAQEANPLSYTAGAVGGAIGGAGKFTAPLAATKVGKAVAGAALPTMLGRGVTGVLKTATPAAVSGGVAGFGNAEGGFDKRINQAGDDVFAAYIKVFFIGI